MRLGLLVIIAQLVACFPGCADAQSTPGQTSPPQANSQLKVSTTPEPTLVPRRGRVIRVTSAPQTASKQPALLKPDARLIRSDSLATLQALPDRHSAAPVPSSAMSSDTERDALSTVQYAGTQSVADPKTEPAVGKQVVSATRADFVEEVGAPAQIARVAHSQNRQVRSAAALQPLPVGAGIEAPTLRSVGEPSNGTHEQPGTMEVTRQSRREGASLNKHPKNHLPVVESGKVGKLFLNPAQTVRGEQSPSITTSTAQMHSKRTRSQYTPVGTVPADTHMVEAKTRIPLKPLESTRIGDEEPASSASTVTRSRRSTATVLPPVGDLPMQVRVDRMPLAYQRQEPAPPQVGHGSPRVDVVSSNVVTPSHDQLSAANPPAAQVVADVERVGHTVDKTNSTRRQQGRLQPSAQAVQLAELQVGQLPASRGIETAALQQGQPSVVVPFPEQSPPNNASIERA